MKVERTTKTATFELNELSVGDVFRYKNNIYILIDDDYDAFVNVFNLTNNEVDGLGVKAIVEYLPNANSNLKEKLMARLNEANEVTQKIIHLLVTTSCTRNCKHCCNKQYDLNDIPYATNDELKKAETVCITGGEPFLFSNPSLVAGHLKAKYPNIKNIYVYTNAFELDLYLKNGGRFDQIDGLNVSIKSVGDLIAFENSIVNNDMINALKSNRLYVFNNLFPERGGRFSVIFREWQKDFIPATDSIFRKL